jgi:hypothetical protein
MFVLVVVGVLAYGYYSSYVGPSRAEAARVGTRSITMGEVVAQMRALGAMGAYSDTQSRASAPQETLISMAENEMVNQMALKRGVTSSDAEVEMYIEGYFYPQPEEGQEVDEAVLEREFKTNYRNFLTKTGLSDGEFRKIIRRNVIVNKMQQIIAESVPNQAEHVEVYWVSTPYGEGYAEAVDKVEAGESFENLCQNYNQDATYADANCYVGWVPRGAFPKLDTVMFSIEHGKLSDITNAENSNYVVKVVAGPEVRDIEATMKSKMEQEAYSSYVTGLWDDYRASKSIAITFNSERDAWAQKQLSIFLPTPTPAPTVG